MVIWGNLQQKNTTQNPTTAPQIFYSTPYPSNNIHKFWAQLRQKRHQDSDKTNSLSSSELIGSSSSPINLLSWQPGSNGGSHTKNCSQEGWKPILSYKRLFQSWCFDMCWLCWCQAKKIIVISETIYEHLKTPAEARRGMSPTDSKIAIKIFWPLNIEILHHLLLAGWMFPHMFQIGLSCIVSTLEQKPVGLRRMICMNMEVKTAIFILENLISSMRNFQCKRMTLHVILCIQLIFPAWAGKVFGRQQLAHHYACHRVHLRWNPSIWTWKRIPFIFQDSRIIQKGSQTSTMISAEFPSILIQICNILFQDFNCQHVPEIQIFVVFPGSCFFQSEVSWGSEGNSILRSCICSLKITSSFSWKNGILKLIILKLFELIHDILQLQHSSRTNQHLFFSNTKELDHKNTICHILFQNGFNPWQSRQTIQVTRTHVAPPRLEPPVYRVQQRTGPKKRSHGEATKQRTVLKSGKRSKVHGLFCQLLIEHFDIALLASVHRGCCLSHLVDMHIFWPWKSEIMSDTPQCWDGWTFVSVQTLIYSCHPKGPHLWLQ